MSRTGRPLALDSARRAALADALTHGATIRSLATIAGVSERTIHNYLAAGLVERPPVSIPPLGETELPRPEPEPLSLVELLDELAEQQGAAWPGR